MNFERLYLIKIIIAMTTIVVVTTMATIVIERAMIVFLFMS